MKKVLKKSAKNKKNKKTNLIDPFYEREAAKYEHPIPSRELIIRLLEKRGMPISFNDLGELLNLYKENDLEALHRRLGAMIRDGQLITDRRHRYALVAGLNLVAGKVTAHRDGYGFLVPDDATADIFLTPKQMRQLFPGDRVLVSVIADTIHGKREGAVVEILSRNFTQIIGRFFVENGVGFVIPASREINQDLVIPAWEKNKVKPGDYVRVEILNYPTARSGATAKVIEILGKKITPQIELEIAFNAYSLPHEWSKAVLKECKAFTRKTAKPRLNGRRDLRHLPFVTIDGEDAKDFDDAVYCYQKTDGSWCLYVAIADVSHYVTPDSALDMAASERGNSVYFPQTVVPMLPEILCNELCSLKPHVDRLALVCEMQLSKKGKLNKATFYEAMICSHARLTYDGVYADLEQASREQPLLPQLQSLKKLYLLLLQQRRLRGAPDFAQDETQIVFGEDGGIARIVPRAQHYVHGIIEECMLLANVSAARFLTQHQHAAIFRVHEPPEADRLTNLRNFLQILGLELKGGKRPRPAHYAALLEQITNHQNAFLIRTVLLRSLKQAIYSVNNSGHFGLAYSEYLHFTSPIRRYPDLLNHRAIKQVLNNDTAIFNYSAEKLAELAVHSSATERCADEASRAVELWYKCHYAANRIGEQFNGTITGVTNFGFFVRLDDILVEGLVHVTSLRCDYYRFDQVRQQLQGKRTGQIYRLGDRVNVILAKVDLENLEITLELSQAKNKTCKRKRGAMKRRKGRVSKK